MIANYDLKYNSRAKSIRISLDPSGKVMVTAPIYVSAGVINQFVVSNQVWIERQTEKIKLKTMANPTLNFQENIVSYLGRTNYIRFEPTLDDSLGSSVIIENGICKVKPVTRLASDLRTTLLNFLQTQAKIVITDLTIKRSIEMQVKYQSIGFGQQSSRWGSCSGKNHLRFNWRLIHFSLDTIDYVVVHELAHTVFHDHSDNFWRMVQKYHSRYKESKTFLKRQILTLE